MLSSTKAVSIQCPNSSDLDPPLTLEGDLDDGVIGVVDLAEASPSKGYFDDRHVGLGTTHFVVCEGSRKHEMRFIGALKGAEHNKNQVERGVIRG